MNFISLKCCLEFCPTLLTVFSFFPHGIRIRLLCWIFSYCNIKPCFPSIDLVTFFHVMLSFVVLFALRFHFTTAYYHNSFCLFLFTYYITRFQKTIFLKLFRRLSVSSLTNSLLDIEILVSHCFLSISKLILCTICLFFITFFKFLLPVCYHQPTMLFPVSGTSCLSSS